MNLNFINFLPYETEFSFLKNAKSEKIIFSLPLIENLKKNPVLNYFNTEKDEMNILVGVENFIDSSEIPTPVPKGNFVFLLTKETNYLFLLNKNIKSFIEKTKPLFFIRNRIDLEFLYRLIKQIETGGIMIEDFNLVALTIIELKWLESNISSITLFGENKERVKNKIDIPISILPDFEKITIKEF